MKTTLVRAALIVALVLVTVAPAVPVAAQTHCASWVDTLIDTTSNCVSEPWRPRASDVETFHWKGHDYLIMNIGNELSIFNIDDPTNPVYTATSDFDFGTRGDSDYDLIDFDVCDDCRYAVLSHKVKRTVIFDLGAAATPDFPAGAWAFYGGSDSNIGGYVFSKGSQQYLFGASLPGGCSAGSTLYTLNGISNLGFVDCVEVGGAEMLVKGVHPWDTGAGFYLYTGAQNGVAQVFRADGTGVALSLVHVASPVGMWGRRYELSIDRNNDLLASGNFTANEIQIWDVANPENPLLLWTIPGQASNVSLRSPSANSASTLLFNVNGWPDSTRTFTVDTAGPVEFGADYWTDPSLIHNNLPVCAFASGGALSPDGSVAFISRYAIHQVFDLSDCLDPTEAVADLAVTPSEIFPGDTVTVRDTTTGRYDRWAVWVTQEPAGTLVAGTTTPSGANPHQITHQIPQNLAWTTSYKAHVKVESDELPPDVASFDTDVLINRTPEATISVVPPAVVVGESVTLTATAEGNPGSNPYTWTIDPPTGVNFFRDGASTPVTLDQSGVWAFYLTVDYQHEAAAGGAYEATAQITGFNVTSVAADFTISPTSPIHTQDIILNASISKPVGGNLSYEWAVESASHVYTGCPAAQVCAIPGESLSPNMSYTVTLTVTNNDDDVSSQKIKAVFVNDGAVDPAIGFSPTNPEIGQNVVFTINGVEADITKATWTMGGSGCDGQSAVQICTPVPPWVDCKAISFKYASGGNKTVGLELQIGSNTFTADPVTLTVASTGTCSGGGGGSCAYALNPTSRVVGDAGTTSSFAVNQISGTGCSFTAATTFPWITIISPTGSDSGSGTVTFRVDANTGPQRVGTIAAGGKGFIVNQNAPWVPPNFTMSNPVPEIGEVVTFSVDPILEVASWDFGEADCNGNSPFINCTYLPGGVCNTMQWAYPTSGTKSITMVLEDGRTQTKEPTVQTIGECCFKDGRPDASFTMSDDEVYVGERVFFTDTTSKSAPNTKALGIGWTPPAPEIGDGVVFTLIGVAGTITKATWDFGESGCGGISSIQECLPSLFDTCHAMSFTFASGGSKAVGVALELQGGGTANAGPVTVAVANSGACDDGGGGCVYTLGSSTATVPPEGGSGSFNVNTTAECPWSATTTSTWLAIDPAAGLGSGSVEFTAAANEGLTTRTGFIKVENKTFKVTQTADEGDTTPTAWQWTVTRIEDEDGIPVDEIVASGGEQNFSHIFLDPGLYRVGLIASNCFGSDSKVGYVSVEEALVEDFVVAAAVSLPGLNLTQWESDFRFFNPCGEELDVRIEYQPEDVNNSDVELIFREFQLAAGETRLFADITEAIPGLVGEELSGSVRIESSSASGCKVLSVSRTFNDTPNGTLGLMVPALPVKRVGRDFLDLTGLIHNEGYRTNLRLVNYSDEDAWVSLVAYDSIGNLVGGPKPARVKGQSTKQLSAVSEWLGVSEDLEAFTIRATISGLDVEGFATVVDNISGDSVLYLSSFIDENQVWVVGVASLAGLNGSNWRTDLWLHNPTDDSLAGQVEFVVGDKPSDVYGFNWPALSPHQTGQYLDVVSDKLGLEEVYGYIVLTGADGGPAPQVSARTYDRDLAGGTYGLNLRAFGGADLLWLGEIAYIPGVSNSDDLAVGFRTNVGVLNTDLQEWAAVSFTMYNIDGTQAGAPYAMTIAPGKLRQFDIFKKFDLGDVTVTGSIEIEIISGGGVAVYATEIDNRTQDSIFIPALRKFMGLAR